MYECFTKLCKTKRLLGNLKYPTLYINYTYKGKNVPWKVPYVIQIMYQLVHFI